MAKVEFGFDAFALRPMEANSATPEILDLATVDTPVLAFDDTTEEYANGVFQVPGDVDTAGTVTFRAYVAPKTGDAAKNVALTFGHRAINDGEAINAAYTDEDSGDKAIVATTAYATEITWTETIANLGWAANDLIIFRFSRPVAAAHNLVGDMLLLNFAIEVPLS